MEVHKFNCVYFVLFYEELIIWFFDKFSFEAF